MREHIVKATTTILGRSVAMAAAVLFGMAVITWAGVEGEGGGTVPPDLSKESSTTPTEYAIPPVNPKSLRPAENHPWAKKTVKNFQGETLGTIDHIMVDTQSGKDMYAMLRLGDDMQPMPIPFKYLKESETGLLLNASKQQLQRGGPNLGGSGKSQDFEHQGAEPLKPNLRQGGG
jgi:hypothetical protein